MNVYQIFFEIEFTKRKPIHHKNTQERSRFHHNLNLKFTTIKRIGKKQTFTKPLPFFILARAKLWPARSPTYPTPRPGNEASVETSTDRSVNIDAITKINISGRGVKHSMLMRSSRSAHTEQTFFHGHSGSRFGADGSIAGERLRFMRFWNGWFVNVTLLKCVCVSFRWCAGAVGA